MESTLRRTWAEIDLDALAHNYETLRRRIGAGVKFLGVVKADAYGHGAVRVAQTLQELGADYLAVSSADEAMELRENGITMPVLILGHTPKEEVPLLIEHHITQAVTCQAKALEYSQEAVRCGGTLKVHIKVDTGMSRLGFLTAGEHFGTGVEAIATADYVHFDVMDGCFVPNISIGIPVLQSIRKRTALPIDVHLMIVQPERYVDQFCDAGADLVTCHVEADTPEKIHLALDKIHAKGKKAGVVLKPNTRAEAVLPFLDKCDIVLVMTVEPGFGGQKFMADMMPKVSAIRRYINERNLDCELEVDGGVDAVTCKTCIEAGANVLVAGSAVYKAADIPAKIKELRG